MMNLPQLPACNRTHELSGFWQMVKYFQKTDSIFIVKGPPAQRKYLVLLLKYNSKNKCYDQNETPAVLLHAAIDY